MIIKVSDKNIKKAAKIHSVSWKESHKEFCSIDFIKKYTVKNQILYLSNEINLGKDIFMLIEHYLVGIISLKDNLI